MTAGLYIHYDIEDYEEEFSIPDEMTSDDKQIIVKKIFHDDYQIIKKYLKYKFDITDHLLYYLHVMNRVEKEFKNIKHGISEIEDELSDIDSQMSSMRSEMRDLEDSFDDDLEFINSEGKVNYKFNIANFYAHRNTPKIVFDDDILDDDEISEIESRISRLSDYSSDYQDLESEIEDLESKGDNLKDELEKLKNHFDKIQDYIF